LYKAWKEAEAAWGKAQSKNQVKKLKYPAVTAAERFVNWPTRIQENPWQALPLCSVLPSSPAYTSPSSCSRSHSSVSQVEISQLKFVEHSPQDSMALCR
jgi:hypothetical protein